VLAARPAGMRAKAQSALWRGARALVIAALLAAPAAAALQVCEGNHTAAQCSALGGVDNKCCFHFDTSCIPNFRVGLDDTCLNAADEEACDGFACCGWVAPGRCAQDRGKLSCPTGVEACTCKGYDESSCAVVGCCAFAGGVCNSDVGRRKCHLQGPDIAAVGPALAPAASTSAAAVAGWVVLALVLVCACLLVRRLVRRWRLLRAAKRLPSHDSDSGMAIPVVDVKLG